MIRRLLYIIFAVSLFCITAKAQINTDQVIQIGRNAIYFEDYVLSIQYFNQAIGAKPYLAQPYYYRGVAKFNLEDFFGAENDASMALERNPFITDAYVLRGMSRQNLGRAKEAIEDYNTALSMQPDNWDLNFKRALAQESIEDYDGAMASYNDIINRQSSFDAAYIGRARLNMTLKDTVSALDDINKAIKINPNAANAYIIRADISINQQQNYQDALADMDKAIKLLPRHIGLFINRAFLRYKLDDYFGAMSDYDYALQLDPLNTTALFNRSVLRTEVRDFNNAIEDLNQLIALNPTNYRALFNRAAVHNELRQYKNALADADAIIASFPDLASAYILRFDIRQRMGDKSAKKDYDYAIKLAKKQKKTDGEAISADDIISQFDSKEDTNEEKSTALKFNQLLTLDNNANLEQDYSGKGVSIRGRIQERNISIEPEPIFVVTYYSAPTELKPSGEYLKEVDEVNRTHSLNYILQVTNREASLKDSTEIKRHFASIEYYNSYLSTHAPRAIDYFGRAMNQMTLHNYIAATNDFCQAQKLAPNFSLAYFMSAVAKYRTFVTDNALSSNTSEKRDMALYRAKLHDVISDFEKALKISPEMYLAYYNMGVVYIAMQDYTSALSAFNKAIELNPDFGEAYYNRGYVYFTLGNRTAGSNDLSHAGQLGVAPSYNLLKRMAD